MFDLFDLSDIPINGRVLRIIFPIGAFFLAWLMTGNFFAAIDSGPIYVDSLYRAF